MTTIMPKGENMRQAVKWISQERTHRSNVPIGMLIDEAALRFNLSPKEEIFLRSRLCEAGGALELDRDL